MNGILDIILSAYGGSAVVVSALTTFLGSVWLKKLVNKDLSKNKLELQHLQDANKKALKELEQAHLLEVESIRAKTAHDIKIMEQQHLTSIEHLKSESNKDLKILKLGNNNQLEKFKNDFKSEYLKHESYSAIAKDQFQILFDKRIETYTKLIKLKNSINEIMLDRAEEIEFSSDDPDIFKSCIEKICKLTQEETMYISNEIALISNELNKTFSEISSQAKVHVMGTGLSTSMRDDKQWHIAMEEAENEIFSRIFSECSPLYNKWFKQLDIDVARIREILDISHDFFSGK